jgi:hypothetical protein
VIFILQDVLDNWPLISCKIAIASKGLLSLASRRHSDAEVNDHIEVEYVKLLEMGIQIIVRESFRV